MSTDKDLIILEVEFRDIARDQIDMDDMDNLMVEKMLEAGIPVSYVYGRGMKKCFRGVLHGSLECKNDLARRSRIITWRRDILTVH